MVFADWSVLRSAVVTILVTEAENEKKCLLPRINNKGHFD